MRSPYQHRPSRSFWRTGVAEAPLGPGSEIYRPKVRIDRRTRIATAGSCFAQHIGRALRARGFTVLDSEPAPEELSGEAAQRFGYGIYSARYGNIYTVRQFVQLLREARGRFVPADPVWEKDGRFYDAMRPSVEPGGLRTPELVALHRAHHLAAVRTLLQQTDVLVFTLGLTETWAHRESGTVYPTAPGTIAGAFDPERHEYLNLGYEQVRGDVLDLRRLLARVNPSARVILTVSPLPLTATAGDDHVLVATTYSKSVLRAVAGSVAATFDDIDYFPSYEIVSGAPSRGRFFGDDLRTVEPEGVATVMATFFAEQDPDGEAAPAAPASSRRRVSASSAEDEDDLVCEDALLEAFAR